MTYNHYGKDIVLPPGLEDSYTVPKSLEAIKTFWVAMKPAMTQVIESHPHLVQSTLPENVRWVLAVHGSRSPTPRHPVVSLQRSEKSRAKLRGVVFRAMERLHPPARLRYLD
jgi:hypothetical protein